MASEDTPAPAPSEDVAAPPEAAVPSASAPPYADVPRVVPVLLALLGLATSLVLEWVHIKTYLLPSVDSFCTVGETLDCGSVALSRLSVVMGVPTPLWGAAGFFAMTAAAWLRSRLLWPLAVVSLLASLGLLLESLLHVGAVCLLCEGVHVLSLLLVVIAWRHHRRRGRPFTAPDLVTVVAVPATIVVATWLLVPAYWAPMSWQQGVPHPHGLDDDGHPWVGASEPTVVAEEFVDYGCPHCASATNRTRRRLASDGDRLRVVRRHQPRMRCHDRNHGCVAQRAAHCAGQQDRFWEMDAWLFVHAPGRADLDVLEGARDLGLDEPTFMLCLEDPRTYAWADAQAMTARKLKIQMTPTYRVDGQSLTPAEYEALLDERL